VRHLSATCGVCCLVGLFRRRLQTEIDPDARSPKTGIKYKDRLVVHQLFNHGADLSQPRHVIYYLYFANEDAAIQAALEASRRSFHVTINEPSPEDPSQWSVISEGHDIVIDPATVLANGDFFDDLADRLDGDYDGWEASVS
jgi:regulator of RNase E activity RraB